MLREGDELVAVVDWEGCRPGDRAFDLVTFCFGMTDSIAAAGADTRVWGHASQLPEEMDRVLGLSFDYLRRVA
jgi:aminoglycoside phosphotransferase (APT) family kinase protein